MKIDLHDFTMKQYAIDWILRNGEHSYVYVIRDEGGIMCCSYVWKKEAKKWGSINNDKYLGDFKIGNPDRFRCSAKHKPDHPCVSSSKNNNE